MSLQLAHITGNAKALEADDMPPSPSTSKLNISGVNASRIVHRLRVPAGQPPSAARRVN